MPLEDFIEQTKIKCNYFFIKLHYCPVKVDK